MFKARERSLILFFLIADLFLLNLSLTIIAHIHYYNFLDSAKSFYFFNVCWFITYLLFINEKLFLKEDFFNRLKSHLVKFAFYISIASFLMVVLNLDNLSRTMFLGSSGLFFLLKFLASYFYSFLIAQRKSGQYYSIVLIVGTGPSADAVQHFYKTNPDIGQVVGFLTDSNTKSDRFHVIGRLSDFKKIVAQNYFNEVIITLHLENNKKIKELIDIAEYHGIRPRVVPNYYSMFNRTYEVQTLGTIPIVNIREVPLERYTNRFWKRAFDIVFSSMVLCIAAPLILVVAVAIKIESRGPVFYKPIRCGRRGTQFTLYKFRSMIENDDVKSGTRSTTKNDQRITRVGKFIRKTNLDELPQFINVLRNEMAVVGPRPHRVYLNKTFQSKVPTYMVRQYIKPGITGWAQVNGWRGPTVTKIQYMGRTLHDLWYIEHWTFLLDIYIIFLTIFGKKARANAF